MKPYAAVISRAAVETSIESSWCRGFLKVLSDDRPNPVGSSRPARCNRMPVELEAKVKVESHEPARQRLRDAGAQARGAHLQIRNFDVGGVRMQRGLQVGFFASEIGDQSHD